MVKICHMTSVHPSNDVRIFNKMCTSLAKEGYVVYLVAQGDSREENGVHVIGVGSKPESRVKRMTSWAKKVYQEALAVDAQIYHFHDPELLPYGLKLKKKGKIVIFDSHEDSVAQMEEKMWIPALIRKPFSFFYRQYHNNLGRKLDAVICVSPNILERFISSGFNAEIVSNFPIIEDHDAIYKTDASSRNIIFAGTINEDWNHNLIMCALEKVPKTTYVLCGSGSDYYMQSLRVLPGWKQVDFRGKIPHVQVPEAMAACSVGMAILRYHRNTDGKVGTLGNTKFFEYMLAGLPVICTDFILWKAIINEHHCGICVDPEDVDAISSSIAYLLDHPEEAREMGENGHRAVFEKYNWGMEEKKLLALYSSLQKKED